MNLLAVGYPLLNLVWTILWISILIGWLMTLFRVIGDIFRSRDLRGVSQAVWLLVILAFPILGVLAYLIVRGEGMMERQVQAAMAAEEDVRSYIRHAAGTEGPATQIAMLAKLRDDGVITDADFEQGKGRVLNA